MKQCELHPPPQELDIEWLQQKYRHERDKRLRPDGGDQYVEATDAFAEYGEVDPHTPRVDRPPISEDIDILIIGCGFAGLLCATRLTSVRW